MSYLNEDRLSPAELEFLLHYYYSPLPHPKWSGFQDLACMWVTQGILEELHTPGLWRVTDKGSAWLEMILATPVPKVSYLDPRFTYKATTE